MIRVTPRVRTRVDRSGDPLDGLVNLFDLGIVLAVAFLIAALASLNLTDTITKDGLRPQQSQDAIPVGPGEEVRDVPGGAEQSAGEGVAVGTVYRLADGRLVYVAPSQSGTGGGAGSTTPTPTPTQTVPAPSIPTP